MTPRPAVADLDGYLEFAHATARAAGEVVLAHFRRPIDIGNKDRVGGYDPVTVADLAAETVIRDAIAAAYPSHGLFGEEHGRIAGASPWTWVIDPIDGTRSFMIGQLSWGILIALNDGVRPVVGVAYQPFVGEAFVAHAEGLSQWRRGSERRTLSTRRCARVEDAIIVTTDPRHFGPAREAAAYASVTRNARLVRYGGDCYCYTQLAMGLCDVVIETGLGPWDIQALIPLIESAGGVITDWRGNPCDAGGDVLACGDPAAACRVADTHRHLKVFRMRDRIYRVEHETVYRYAKPVRFLEHRLLYRPRSSHEFDVLASSLEITPPADIREIQDVFSNSVTLFTPRTQSDTLRVRATFAIRQSGAKEYEPAIAPSAERFPFDYTMEERRDLGARLEPHYPDPDGKLYEWTATSSATTRDRERSSSCKPSRCAFAPTSSTSRAMPRVRSRRARRCRSRAGRVAITRCS